MNLVYQNVQLKNKQTKQIKTKKNVAEYFPNSVSTGRDSNCHRHLGLTYMKVFAVSSPVIRINKYTCTLGVELASQATLYKMN